MTSFYDQERVYWIGGVGRDDEVAGKEQMSAVGHLVITVRTVDGECWINFSLRPRDRLGLSSL